MFKDLLEIHSITPLVKEILTLVLEELDAYHPGTLVSVILLKDSLLSVINELSSKLTTLIVTTLVTSSHLIVKVVFPTLTGVIFPLSSTVAISLFSISYVILSASVAFSGAAVAFKF